MKKTLMISGAIFIVIIILLGGVFAYFSFKGLGLDKGSRIAAGTAINIIGKKWSPADLFRVSIPFMNEDENTRKQSVEILEAINKTLGPVQRYDSLKGEAKINIYNGKKSIWAEYWAKIFCKNDSGTIYLYMDYNKDKWLIRRFNVDSRAFLKGLQK